MTALKAIPNPKLITLEVAEEKRLRIAKEGKQLVITNGCFDLLHPGHLYFLQEAAKQGDELWILLNSNASIQELKGPQRPVQGELERAYGLAALECVSHIVVFNTLRLTKEIIALKPNTYAKAGDYTLEKLDPGEREALEKVGASIKFLPFLEGFSTTSLIQKICSAADTF